MQKIRIGAPISDKLSNLRLGCIECSVLIGPSDEKIRSLSETIIHQVRSGLGIEQVSQKPTIRETKEAYRVLGKDPSRYRPSAEALTRRIVNGKDLYWINNIVDLLNLISLESGFSIGGYDADKIMGDIELGVGQTNEPYEGIGRGELNVEDLPVFRDDLGAFGSPTSDSLRTMVTDQTKRFLMVIIDFAANEMLKNFMTRSLDLYGQLVQVKNIETKIIQ
jgi:DNA/RNA-binding domain of Phe-tRNA-synthetase-like protein